MRIDSFAQRSSSASSPAAICASSSGRSSTFTSVQASAAYRFDCAPMWMIITSRATCTARSPAGASAHASHICCEVVARPRAGALALGEDLADHRLDPAHRAPLDPLAGRGREQRAPRAHERIRRVEPVEQRHEAIEVARRGGLGARPAAEAEPMAEPARPRERLERPAGAERRELVVDRALEVLEIALHFLVAEQVVRAVAPPDRELERDLVLEHERERGEPEARLVLGQRVQPPHALGREHEEQPVAEHVRDERVAERRARAPQVLGGAAQQPRRRPHPRPVARRDRRHRVDRSRRTDPRARRIVFARSRRAIARMAARCRGGDGEHLHEDHPRRAAGRASSGRTSAPWRS